MRPVGRVAELGSLRPLLAHLYMNYYYSTDGTEVQGPYTLSDLSSYFSTGALPATTQVCAEGTEKWQTLSSLLQPPSNPTIQQTHRAPQTTTAPTDKPDTKPCPMCGEHILSTAKKCKHCGEYLDGSIPPHQSSPERDLTALHIQTKMKSVGVAAALSILLWPFGCLYSSIGACLFGIAGILVMVGVVDSNRNHPEYFLVLVPVYLISVFITIGSASSYNRKLVEEANKQNAWERGRC